MKTEKFYSTLHGATKSGAHFQLAKRDYMSGERTASEALSEAFRAVVDGSFSIKCAVLPDTINGRTKDGAAQKAAFMSANAGKIIIKQAEQDQLQAMRNSAVKALAAPDLERVVLSPYRHTSGLIAPGGVAMLANKERSKLYFFTAVSDLAAYGSNMGRFGIFYRIGLHMLQARATGYNIGVADIIVVAVSKTAPHEVQTFSARAEDEGAILAAVEGAFVKMAALEAEGNDALPAVVHTSVAFDAGV